MCASTQLHTASDGDPGFSLRFWGVRGSIPTPGPTTLTYGGNTSCIEVRVAGRIIILDAGTGLRPLGVQLSAEFAKKPLDLTLLLTHTHWDHIQGLPFFSPMFSPQNRLRILGYEGARVGLDTVLSSQMENPFFPIGLKEVPANVQIEELKEWKFSLGPVEVEARQAHHPGVCVGYKLSWQGKSLTFFPDNEMSEESIRHARLSQIIRGTDVLIMDAQYDHMEYQDHTGWGHGCVDKVVDLALDCEVKQLFLFHHDPNHDDQRISQMVEHARKLAAGWPLRVDAAREGLSFAL